MVFAVPSPVYPTEKDLPRSDLRLRLCGGEIVEVLNVPLQGPKTLAALLKTLELWKPVIVGPEPEYHI